MTSPADDDSFNTTCLILSLVVTVIVILLLTCITITLMICRSQRKLLVSDYDIRY